MLFFTIFLFGLVCITGSLATPLSHTSSNVRRGPGPPVPSPYPLGSPHPNEWQYLNFDPNDDNDKTHLGQLHDVVGFDLNELLGASENVLSEWTKIYLRYFPASDDEDDYHGHVTSVYNQLGTNGGASPLVATFIVDNLDFNNGKSGKAQCSDGSLAYTDTDDLDSREKTHFCDPAYTRPQLTGVQCSALDPFPSTKMDTLSRIGLHEMTHYSTVGPPSALGQQIIDVKNADGFGAYDPDRCHGLIDPDQDDNPAVTEINADSYAWTAQDGYFSFACSTDPEDAADYFTDPPPYDHGDDDSDEAA